VQLVPAALKVERVKAWHKENIVRVNIQVNKDSCLYPSLFESFHPLVCIGFLFRKLFNNTKSRGGHNSKEIKNV
jgi:hypothetical protein